MDVAIAAGSTVTLVAAGRRVPLKVVSPARIRGDAGRASTTCRISVIGPTEAISVGVGEVELVTASGVVRLPGRVVDDGRLTLLVGAPGPVTQRRREVRGDVQLPIVVTLPTRPDQPDQGLRVVRGRTRNLSAGGFLATLDAGTGRTVDPGDVVQIEIQLPDGAVVATRVTVVELTHFGLRAAFTALDTASTDRIARVVFAQERERLAARRRDADRRDGLAAPGRRPGW